MLVRLRVQNDDITFYKYTFSITQQLFKIADISYAYIATIVFLYYFVIML